MSDPIRIQVVRYRCPHCPKTYSGKSRTAAHMARCWYNPAARGCKTREHFMPQERGLPDECAEGVSLAGTDPFVWPEVKPGPITGCPKWQIRTDLID